MKSQQTGCTCNAAGAVHAAHCGCHYTETFLREPASAYLESRRSFLRKLAVGGIAAATLPALLAEEAQADIFKPSASDQKRLGEQAAQDILKKYPEVKGARGRRFSKVGSDLVDALSKSEQDKWNYRFRVVESKDINAFALPGGNMFIFTGLLDRIKSNDELAAVTAHEIAHVRGEHWARQVADQQKRELGLGLLLGLAKANRTTGQITGLLNSLYTLKYSRDDEYNADSNGLKNMDAAGFDPQGMIKLFQTLQNASGGGGGPEFLSTHPLSKDRIRRVETYIDRRERD